MNAKGHKRQMDRESRAISEMRSSGAEESAFVGSGVRSVSE